MQSYPNTPIVVQFLATSLARFMAINRLNGQVWTKLRVAQYITQSTDIVGEISDTTLGRFLDPAHPQKPTDGTVSVVAQFLMLMRAVTSDQIALAHKSSAYWKASIFTDVFDFPKTKKYGQFLNDISGRYGSMNLRANNLLLSEIILEHIPVANALVVNEITSLFQIGNIEHMSRVTRNFDPLYFANGDRALRSAGARLKTSLVTTGYVTATSETIAFYNRPSGRGFTSILNISSLLFSPKDKIVGFKGSRNVGWKPETVGQISIPVAKNANWSDLDRIKSMSISLDFIRLFIDKIQTIGHDQSQKPPHDGKRVKDFYFNAFDMTTNDQPETPTASPDDQLIFAFSRNDFEAFVKALHGGADANIVPPGQSDPIVFSLARDGEIDWVTALVNIGRCDLTQSDANGFLPSHAAGATARQLCQDGVTSAASERFAQLSEFLQNAEIEQAINHPSPSNIL